MNSRWITAVVLGIALVFSSTGCSSSSSSQVTVNGVTTCSISFSNKTLSDVVASFSDKLEKTVVIADGIDANQTVSESQKSDSWETCMEAFMSKIDMKVEFDEGKDEYRIVNK